ncbi:hypothetical protein M427DRAFT_158811 [Gonapodya prolifera JEL478]|uniref:Uncharacterized protein n=1 Tax=Gonapodya prolifera (strain JEL478) TaxID=1344416 RepID=A0A139A260_GONPJ|nr:hypothetical protein M427DRAFT_158811 [Gonapodya prolifera JEL478]|eukprot:KXS10831.1 hypothetical protein M427DRAFT_158811 [Gonapodya prolifera JEL478]
MGGLKNVTASAANHYFDPDISLNPPSLTRRILSQFRAANHPQRCHQRHVCPCPPRRSPSVQILHQFISHISRR